MPEVKPLNQVELVKDIKLPAFFFNFSRKGCQVFALELSKAGLFKPNPEISSYLMKKLAQAPKEVNNLASTRILRQTLPYGIAFHHAGLIPLMKELVEELFGQGLINVLYTTETFAVGINMPAKTVCFASLRKFDGMNFRFLNSKEYFQIAGRAGRRGIDTVGYVITMIYRPTFRYEEVKAITSADVEPIQSQFRISINTVLNLIEQHTPKEIEQILRLSFFSYQKFGENYAKVPSKVLLATYNNIVRRLEKYDYVKEGKLTSKGQFSAKIFSDEITIGEIFATDFVDDLDEYQILLLLSAIAYEYRDTDQFQKTFKSDALKQLEKKLYRNEYLSHEQKFENLPQITALIHPIYNGQGFFDIIPLTNLLEGDLIRFYAQILDKIGQIKKATKNYKLVAKIDNCKGIIDRALEGIYLV